MSRAVRGHGGKAFVCSIDIAAEPAACFALSQDYTNRLAWDPFLREARLLDGAQEAALGVRAWCVARSGASMETQYVSFNPPTTCAVEMTRGPWYLQSFAGSWRFEALEGGRTRIRFSYQVVGRPRWISWPMRIWFLRVSRRRLKALKDALVGRGELG